MPSRKGVEQALLWLKSKMEDRDTLDAINAELCYNIIMDLQAKRKVIGALYHQQTVQNRSMKAQWDDIRCREACEIMVSEENDDIDRDTDPVHIPSWEVQLAMEGREGKTSVGRV